MRAAALLLALALAGCTDAGIRVIDGDTIALGREPIRIVGLDAPETARARCPSERRQGYAARDRLTALLAQACGPLATARANRCIEIDRSDAPDRYRRSLARISASGQDVAATLIAEGHARPYECPHGHCPRRAGWCGGSHGRQ